MGFGSESKRVWRSLVLGLGLGLRLGLLVMMLAAVGLTGCGGDSDVTALPHSYWMKPGQATGSRERPQRSVIDLLCQILDGLGIAEVAAAVGRLPGMCGQTLLGLRYRRRDLRALVQSIGPRTDSASPGTASGSAATWLGMDTFGADSLGCDIARKLISAAVDGELRGDENKHLRLHLGACQECSLWQERAYSLRRAIAVQPVQSVCDLTPIIMRCASVPYVGSGDWVRILLGAVSLTMLVRAAPAMILGGGPAVAEHADRHLGAFGVALAVGLGFAAWRPERAVGLVPLASALVMALIATGISDLIGGRSAVFAEAGHLLELAGLVLLWLLAGGSRLLLRHLPLRHRAASPDGGFSTGGSHA